MKFLALALIAATAVSPSVAFTAGLARTNNRNNNGLSLSARVDSSELVKEAMKITDKFGSTSAEARLAWETVEEIDASDNSAASAGSLNDECEVDAEVIPRECLDYNAALEELQVLLASTAPVSSVSSQTVEPVKIPGPVGVAAPQSKELQAALKEARIVSSKKGLASPEAKAAWLAVEEIAASGTTNAVGSVLSDDECTVEEAAQEACAALEELNKLIGGTASNP